MNANPPTALGLETPPRATAQPLDPTAFSFHGFDDLAEPLATKLEGLTLRRGPTMVSVIEEAVYVPPSRFAAANRPAGKLLTEGGLVARDGSPISLATSLRRDGRFGERVMGSFSQPVAVEPSGSIDEDVVYLGWFLHHFGHFLTDSIARTWILPDIDPSVKVVFHSKRGTLPSGITLQILERFGIPPERILLFTEPTTLRRVIVPEPLYELSVSAHERFAEWCRQVMAPSVGSAQPLDQPVYLSRRLLSADLRQIIGEFELEEVLRENGFHIAYPETMTLDDQIRLFDQHADVFAAAGSAIYSSFFASNRPKFHFLTAGVPRGDFFLAPALIGSQAAYCNCLDLGSRPSPAISTTPLRLDFPALVDYLGQGGFLKKRLRASLVTRVPRLEDAFDEAWFCATVRDVPRGEKLAAGIEAEALERSTGSWPLTWLLAHYQTFLNESQVDDLVAQFVALVRAERDINRLAKHHEEVASMALRVLKRCSAETAACLSSVLSERFFIDQQNRRRSKEKRRRAGGRRDADTGD